MLGTWSLISQSWNDFIKQWNETFKVSIWFLYFGLVSFTGALLEKVSPAGAFDQVNLILAVIVSVGYIWSGIRLIRAVLEIEAGQKPSLDVTASQKAAQLILPIIGVGLLQLIVTVGGFILFIIPGIYLMIALSFAQVIRIDTGEKGFKVLSASRELVKGRWWQTLWRLFAGNFIFGLGIGLILSLLIALLASISGTNAFLTQGTDAFKSDPLMQGAYDLLQATFQAAVMPLFIFFQVKLYKNLKATM